MLFPFQNYRGSSLHQYKGTVVNENSVLVVFHGTLGSSVTSPRLSLTLSCSMGADRRLWYRWQVTNPSASEKVVVTDNTQSVGQCCMSDHFPQTQPAFAYKLQSVKNPIINAGT